MVLYIVRIPISSLNNIIMKKFLIIGVLFLVMPFALHAQTSSTATLPASSTVESVYPGLLPGDFFYFLDRWGEAVRAFLAFSNEAKARLNLEYARERAAEIKQVLGDPTRKLKDVAEAQQNFEQHIVVAAANVKEEKANGTDVSRLAKELDDELDASHSDIKDALIEHEGRASTAEANLRAKIAALAAGDPQIGGLTTALEAITKEREDAQNESIDLENKVLDQQAIFEDAMGPRISAEKHLEQVLRLREWMGKQDGGLLGAFSSSTERLLKQAEDALKQGDFETAKNLSEEAKHSVEKTRESKMSDDESRGIEANTPDSQERERSTENQNKRQGDTGRDDIESDSSNNGN